MSNSTIPDMKEIFRQAAEIAALVPENMQVAAFNRALDMLTGASVITQPATASGLTTPSAPAADSQRARLAAYKASNVDDLIAAIDTTQHPAVASAAKALDRSLMVLQIALRSHELDGMTPPEIARVLTEKFRLNTSADAVTMALGSATTLVNRISRGRAYEYKIMGPGEEYLKHLGTNDGGAKVSFKPSSRPTKKARKKSEKIGSHSKPEKSAKPKSGRVGPKQMLEKLIAEGYFSMPRDISQIIEYLQNNYARTYKSSDLSPTLTRLLRENSLERAKNEKGIFQYTASRKT